MKYIKTINELFTDYTIYPYVLVKDGLRYVEYTFTTKNDIVYKVEFMYIRETWHRNFITIDGNYEMVGNNDVYNVLATISEITVEFLKERDVSFMSIEHIPTNEEPMDHKVSNKRSRVNRAFLQKWLPDDYVYRLVGSVSRIRKRDI